MGNKLRLFDADDDGKLDVHEFVVAYKKGAERIERLEALARGRRGPENLDSAPVLTASFAEWASGVMDNHVNRTSNSAPTPEVEEPVKVRKSEGKEDQDALVDDLKLKVSAGRV